MNGGFAPPTALDWGALILSSVLLSGIFLLSQHLAKLGVPSLLSLGGCVLTATLVMLISAAVRRQTLIFTRDSLPTYALIAITYILAPSFLTLFVSKNLPAYLFTLIGLLSTPLTYFFSALLGMERFGPKQFGALAVVMGALALIVLERHTDDAPLSLFWLGLAFLLPLSWTVTNIMRARLWRPHYTITSYLSGVLCFGLLLYGLLLIPVGAGWPQLLTPPAALAAASYVPWLVVLGVGYVAYYWLVFFMVRRTGPSFSSNNGIINVLLTLPFGFLLFGQVPGVAALVASVIAIIGTFWLRQMPSKPQNA